VTKSGRGTWQGYNIKMHKESCWGRGGNLKERGRWEDLHMKYQDNIKSEHKGIEWECVDWNNPAQDRPT
jgi:hypothetical protein